VRRHRFEPAALVMGLVLITLAVFFLLDASGVWDLSRPPWRR
jgi:cytochrome oxidase assembly protein ShyY1